MDSKAYVVARSVLWTTESLKRYFLPVLPARTLPDSFPEGTLFADVEGVLFTLIQSTSVCRAWDGASSRRFSIASFNHNGTLIPEYEFRLLIAKLKELSE